MTLCYLMGAGTKLRCKCKVTVWNQGVTVQLLCKVCQYDCCVINLQSGIISRTAVSGLLAEHQNMLLGLPIHFIRFDN